MPVSIATSTILQQAFRFIEFPAVSSLSDDEPAVVQAALEYDTALGMVLETEDWFFASRSASISKLTDSPITLADPRFPYAFNLPTDCVLLREVVDDAVKFRLDEGGMLRCDADGPLAIRYTRTVTNENAMPATIRICVALQLAVLMAPNYIKVQSKQDRLENRLGALIAKFAKTNAKTASTEDYHDNDSSDWVTGAKL